MALPGKKVNKTAPSATKESIVGQAPAELVTVKIRKGTEYSKESIEVSHSVPVAAGDDANSIINSLIEELDGITDNYISAFIGNDAEEGGEEEGGEEEGGEEEGNDVTEDDIRGMSKKELVAFIKENDIEVDPTEYKKLSDLQDAVVEAVVSEEGGEEEGGEDGGEEITEDDIRGMNRKELTAFIKENDLDVDPTEYKKLSDLQDAVVEQISNEEESLTAEDVLAMDRAQLIDLIDEHELDVDPKKFKKLSLLAEAVAEAMFSEEGEFGDFEDTEFGDDE